MPITYFSDLRDIEVKSSEAQLDEINNCLENKFPLICIKYEPGKILIRRAIFAIFADIREMMKARDTDDDLEECQEKYPEDSMVIEVLRSYGAIPESSSKRNLSYDGSDSERYPSIDGSDDHLVNININIINESEPGAQRSEFAKKQNSAYFAEMDDGFMHRPDAHAALSNDDMVVRPPLAGGEPIANTVSPVAFDQNGNDIGAMQPEDADSDPDTKQPEITHAENLSRRRYSHFVPVRDEETSTTDKPCPCCPMQ
jgi:hypothetical protein